MHFRPLSRLAPLFFATCLALASFASGAGVGGPLLPPAAPEFPLPFYAQDRPVFQTAKTGNAVFELQPARVSGLPVDEGLSVVLQPSRARGAHSLQLTWNLADGGADWSRATGLELWFKPAAGDALDFVDEIGVVGARFRFELTDAKGKTARTFAYIDPENWGDWQRLRLRLRFGARWDAELDRAQLRRVTLIIPVLREKVFGFTLAGLGAYREEPAAGPSLAVHARPLHLMVTPEEAFSFTLEASGLPAGEAAHVVVQARDVFGATEEKRFDFVSKGADLNLLSASSTFFANRGQGHLSLTATLWHRDREVYRAEWMMGSLPGWSPALPRPGSAMPWGFWPGAGADAEMLGGVWTRLRINLERLDDPAYEGLAPLDTGEWRVVHRAPRGLRAIAFFGHVPTRAWQNPAQPTWRGGVNWEVYGALVEEAARRCRNAGIEFYEVINEPNTSGGPSIAQLVDLHRVTYEAVKRADPSARVMGPSPYLLSVDYVEKFFAAGGARWIDDLAMHAYNSNEETLIALPRLRKLLDEHGRPEAGIYITEVGVNSPPYSPLRQACLTVQRNILLFSQNVKAINWHALGQWGWEKPGTIDGRDLGFATMTYGGEPTPAFVAYGVMTRLLGEVRPAGVVPDLPAESRGFRFASPSRTVDVIWSESGDTDLEVTVPVSASTQLHDLMGRPLPLDSTSGRARLRPTQAPLYLVTSKEP